MAEKCFVIVESPTKAKTIRKYLPKNFIVEASMGHLRDLPQTAADVPAKYKKEPWARVGVNVDADFEPLYVTVKGKSKIISDLKKKMKEADVLYLATDEDREGESISWHLIEILKPKIPVKRMVFHEITKKAIQKALEDCREIDTRLVHAQEARRILDRLVGFTLSPLIWKKIAYGLSAGRVQSAGLRLLVERERERRAFVKAEYWDVLGQLSKSGKAFEAKLHSLGGKPIALGKDFDELTGKPKKPEKVVVLDEAAALSVVNQVKSMDWTVTQVEEKTITSRPVPPFITSTLQQEANRKLGLSAKNAMRIAQTLYEQGLITYMRTDSPNLSSQAIQGARDAVETLYGKEYLSPEPRQYSSKSKGAQEAHEAIRPAGEVFQTPKETGLSGKELALYDLIWKRTIATQMADAKKLSVSAKFEAGDALFTASGRRITFAGYLRAYVEGSDDPEGALDDKEVMLPELKEGEVLKVQELTPQSHETKPAARFTEASLVQRLEKEGIGRPSTYASIIGTVVDRGYARKIGNALVPTFTGFAVIQLLEKYFDELVSYQFTSQMENRLDEIAEGKREWVPYLKEFYLGDDGLQNQVNTKEKGIDAEESRTIRFFKDGEFDLKVGRFGPYVIKKVEGGEDIRASIPEDVSPADLTQEMVEEIIEVSAKGPQSLGKHPETGEDIYCLLGRYGPYVQQGEMTEENPKPRRASVPKEMDYRNLTLEEALHLLSLPRELGVHPETGNPIMANRGRFGPYIAHGDDFRSLKKEDDVYTVTLARALEILSQEKKGRGGAKMVRDLGKHPETEKKMAIYEGKYGPYIKIGTKNVSLPKEHKAEEVTVEEVVKIIGDLGGAKKKTAQKKTSKKKKTTKKKVTKKKT